MVDTLTTDCDYSKTDLTAEWDHLQKDRGYSKVVANIINNNSSACHYDRPWDDWQNLLADVEPWSSVQQKRHTDNTWNYVPSWMRHSWD